jgi:hypothetical protein
MSTCCICQKTLPNKYAVAGTCETGDCAAVFCGLHWTAGNRLCPQHGWRGEPPTGPSDFRAGLTSPAGVADGAGASEGNKKESSAMGTPEQPAASESRIREWARTHLTAEQAKKVMHATVAFAAQAGKAASGLAARLRNEKNPGDMLTAIDASLAANTAKSQPLTERSEAIYTDIAARKKVYEAAPPARKKLLELELRNRLAEYKAVERELTAFYDNEHSLNVVRGRLLELMAHGMRKLDEADIDRLTDAIEDVVDDAEGVRDSVRDLDKAGPRRDRDSDQESFADALAGFDDEAPTAATEPATAAPLPEAVRARAPQPARKEAEPAEEK